MEEKTKKVSRKKEYQGYDSWEKFLNKYHEADFNNSKTRENFRKDFKKVSKLMWKCWLENNSSDELADAISEAWCSGKDIEKRDTMKEIYEAAYWYCFYASDRMNINRWLRVRILLNYDIE